MALQSAQAEQQLLYALRNPNTPLADRLAHASSALDQHATSLSLPPLVRDWALDVLVRAARASSPDPALTSPELWAVVARTTEAASSSSTALATLPIFTAVVAVYPAVSSEQAHALLPSVVEAWKRLATGAMRKSAAGPALDGYDKLVEASLKVYGEQRGQRQRERELWEELAVVWLKALKAVVLEGGKGDKKVPMHTLSLLPKLLPLLSLLPPTSTLRLTLLSTIQFALFNLENLRRGMARETYIGGGSTGAVVLTADGEVLAALAPLLSSSPSAVLSALPLLTAAYLSSLAANSAALFPLPAKANFPTPSAQKSALEVLGLSKRRELAGRWVKGVVELLGWQNGNEAMDVDGNANGAEEDKAAALAGVLGEVEKEDLYRAGQAGEGWEGVLSSVVAGAVARLTMAEVQPAVREALVEAILVVSRLSYESVEPELPAVLAVLARTPSSSTPSSAHTADFLSHLIHHHSRSVTLPTLLSLLSDALASTAVLPPTARPANNLLTAHTFLSKLGHAVSGLVGGASGAQATYESLIRPVKQALQPSSATGSGAEEVDQAGPSPAKKRKLSSSPGSPSDTLSAAARLRILTVFLAHVPASTLSSLVGALKTFEAELVEPRLKDFAKAAASGLTAADEAESDLGTPSKKEKKKRRKSGLLPFAVASSSGVDPSVRLGVELLEVRCAAIERLAREGLLETAAEDDEKWWVIKAKRREGLKEVVEKGTGESAIAAARTLFQHVELSQTFDDEAQGIVKAVLDRVASGSEQARWSSFLREIKDDEISVALWELATRRNLAVVESAAAEVHLQQFVEIVLRAIATPAPANELSVGGATSRLLRRADFWELPRIQAQLQPALLALVTLPSLASPAPLLVEPVPEKTLSSLRSLSASTLLSSARLFPSLAAAIPLEYLSKANREQLSERALALDLWISTSEVDGLGEAEKEVMQRGLREFVEFAGAIVPNLGDILTRLFARTLPGAKNATLKLYRSLVQTALTSLKSTSSPSALIGLLQTYGDKPLADLPKRAKKGKDLALSTEESAFLVLLESLANSLSDSESVPTALSEAVQGPAKSAFKAFDKALPLITSTLQEHTESFLDVADVLEAARSMWVAKKWPASGQQEDASTYVAFTDGALKAAFTQLSSFSSDLRASSSVLAFLRLLAYRIHVSRPVATGEEEPTVSTELFETFVACHLAFRQALPASARPDLDDNLVRCVSSVSLAEYSAVLGGISGTVGETASRDLKDAGVIDELERELEVAFVLLRDGPEGSSRVASAALSELLRHLALLVERLEEQAVGGADLVRAYLIAARFLEGTCGERPMLLSRLNISNTFALVSRVLQPSASTASSTRPAASDVATLFSTLATSITHLVRHRKDHVVPLFPLLVSALSGFVAILRRAGYGTTGSGSALEDVDASVALGQRAEREAKATFPSWVWEGGSQAIGRSEARALGRLLGALTAKTAAPTSKRKKEATSTGGAADEGPSTTTSLTAPLSKHAPFLLLTYLRACVHPTCPIPSALRLEMQGGWLEVMDTMGKWEKEALMKGFLDDDEEPERGVLRGLYKTWEKERYRG
ncbi:hypothetical protein JCM8097_005446 [Rhodosporidiobolus ruineniae]